MIMEALSVLEKAAVEGKIKLHPKCEDPRVTHLLFAVLFGILEWV